MYPYLNPKNELTNLYFLGEKIKKAINKGDEDTVFVLVHDMVVSMFKYKFPWFKPNHNEELDEIATYIGEEIIKDNRYSSRDLTYIENWMRFLQKRVIPRYTARYRSTYKLQEDLSGIKRNPNAYEEFSRLSGFVEGDPYYVIDEVYSRNSIKLDAVFDFVMDNYCVYGKRSLIRKYLMISLMETIKRKQITLYKLDKGYASEVKFLLKQFLHICLICIEHGVYYLDE